MTAAGKGIGLVLWLLACSWSVPASGRELLAPPADVVVTDAPNDSGNGLQVTWTLSPDDLKDAEPRRVLKYEVIRRWTEPGSDGKDGEQKERRSTVPFGEGTFLDPDCSTETEYRYAVRAVGPGDITSQESPGSGAARPVVNWFDFGRTGFLGILLFVCGAVVICTELARRGKPVYVRPIAGLQAIEEAVGRSTEMGKPMLFIPGIVDINDIETVAGLTVLSTVARTAAEYDTPLEVPTSRTLVMTAAREVAEAAALAAGRPEAYDENRIHYITDEQFGYVAYVCGWMQREKPAACFYLGKFFAESLLLAETGNSIGAIQVAGTAEASQMPFFVAACDYTLIGEELFAASAYLSGEPHQLGILRGQDLGKILAVVLLVAGSGLVTAQVVVGGAAGLDEAIDFLKLVILHQPEQVMKSFIPMILAAVVGWVMVTAFFVPPLRPWQQTAEEWFQIIAAVSLLYGCANLVLHHLKKVSDQAAGWGYSVVTIATFAVTCVVGMLKWGVPPAESAPRHPWSGAYMEEGGAFWWIYEYAMSPLVSTMFALLAFYVASAAFRAFRAKNTEAIVLLVTAFIVLLGRTYDGTVLTSFLPDALSGLTIPGLTMTIMSVFNTAGQRAIMIGIALGVAATSLRILLLQDRSYLGSGD